MPPQQIPNTPQPNPTVPNQPPNPAGVSGNSDFVQQARADVASAQNPPNSNSASGVNPGTRPLNVPPDQTYQPTPADAAVSRTGNVPVVPPAPPDLVPPPPPKIKAGGLGLFKPKTKADKEKLSTQDAILISEIRDGLVIMRDGSLRSVVMCQSINFDLMSPGERESVEFSYQGFLNSLYFPIQIFIRSERVDLNNYLNKLQDIHTNQENILLGLLMEDYIAYVRYLVEAANVMDKQFYIVISYYPPLISQAGMATRARRTSSLFGKKQGTIVINEADYARYKSELAQRVQVVLSGMSQMGVQAVPLNTQELIELYYSVYNPQTATAERLTDVTQLEAPVIEKGQGPPPEAP